MLIPHGDRSVTTQKPNLGYDTTLDGILTVDKYDVDEIINAYETKRLSGNGALENDSRFPVASLWVVLGLVCIGCLLSTISS